jgi:hypothetical protein
VCVCVRARVLACFACVCACSLLLQQVNYRPNNSRYSHSSSDIGVSTMMGHLMTKVPVFVWPYPSTYKYVGGSKSVHYSVIEIPVLPVKTRWVELTVVDCTVCGVS